MDKLFNYIEQYISLDDELKKQLNLYFEAETFKKNEHLVPAGKICKKLYFIQKGVCRTYYLQDGKDVTNWIYPEENIVVTWSSFINQVVSFENIQALDNVEVLSISFDKLQYLYKSFPKMETFGRKLMEQEIAFIDLINHEFLFATAKERYDKLLSIYPDIVQIAKLGHIASFLGITQETLSRIRKMR